MSLTAHFKLAVFLGLEHRLGEAEPRKLLAELRQEVMGEETHQAGQRVEDKTQDRL